jgi:hypothetical protein
VSLTAAGGTTETRQEDRPRPHLRRYELRIRTGVSRALTATFRHRTDDTVIGRNTARRLRVVADTDDIPDVLRRLTECDVDVLELRVCRLPN